MPSQNGIETNVLIYFKIAQSELKWSENKHNKPQNNTFSNGYLHRLHSHEDPSLLVCYSS